MNGLRCPRCKSGALAVIETRLANCGIRRRRKCEACGDRFATIERIMPQRLTTKIKARAVVLRKSGNTYDEIARRLHVSTSTVWQALNG